MNIRRILTSSLLAIIPLAGCAQSDGSAGEPARQVTVSMGEMWFETSDSVFVAGVPYRFVLTNKGTMPHEWAVVPRDDADERNLLFEVEEEDLAPGATVTREFVFDEPGEYDFSCFMPGHYQSGMTIPIRVVADA